MAETKIFDIAKPGKSAPASTSKPVIVTNRPILQDPMVVQATAAAPSTTPADTAKSAAISSPSREKVIAPLKITLNDGSEKSQPNPTATNAEPNDVVVIPDTDKSKKTTKLNVKTEEEEERDLGEIAVEAIAGPPDFAEDDLDKPSKAAATKPSKPGMLIADLMRKAANKRETPSAPELDPSVEAPEAKELAVDAPLPKEETPPATEADDGAAESKTDETPQSPDAPLDVTVDDASTSKAETVEEAAADATPLPMASDSIGSETAEANKDDAQLAPLEDEKLKAAEAIAKEREAEVEKIIESQQFFLPINAVERRKTKRHLLVALLIMVVLGIAWADLALDAGILQIDGVKAPTDFFKQ